MPWEDRVLVSSAGSIFKAKSSVMTRLRRSGSDPSAGFNVQSSQTGKGSATGKQQGRQIQRMVGSQAWVEKGLAIISLVASP